tara:strand:+ start:5997 stop:6278 length:282 start_codon:yes stop_codon:yes gene_type:complete
MNSNEVKDLPINAVTTDTAQSGSTYTVPAGKWAYIFAVMNADNAAAAVGFPASDGLGTLNIPGGAALSLPTPIKCSKFQVTNSNITVLWRDEG